MAARIAATQRVWDDDERDADFTDNLGLGSIPEMSDTGAEQEPAPRILSPRGHNARVHPEPAMTRELPELKELEGPPEPTVDGADNRHKHKHHHHGTVRGMLTRVSSLAGGAKSKLGQMERQLHFEQRMGSAELAQHYRMQVQHVRNVINEGRRARRRVIHPLRSRWVPRWDAVTTLALLYTATLTPFEAAFLEPTLGPSAWGSGWFLANRLLDVIFLLDLVLQVGLSQTKSALTAN